MTVKCLPMLLDRTPLPGPLPYNAATLQHLGRSGASVRTICTCRMMEGADRPGPIQGRAKGLPDCYTICYTWGLLKTGFLAEECREINSLEFLRRRGFAISLCF